MKVAILGSDGFVGKGLARYLSKHYEVCGISRTNYPDEQKEKFDVFINANGNSRRYWANNNILDDFSASTVSVYRTFFDFKFDLYIYLSSADVYPDHAKLAGTGEGARIDPRKLCPYGFHKYLSESIVKKFSEKYLILRCSAMVGDNLRKGPIKDISGGVPLFVTSDSKLQFISVSEVATIIKGLLMKNVCNEIFNVGGKGTVAIDKIGKLLRRDVQIRDDAEKQVYELKIDKLKRSFEIKSSKEYILEYFKHINDKR